MRSSHPTSLVILLVVSACQPEPTASADGVATSADEQSDVAPVQEQTSEDAPSAAANAPDVDEVSVAGIGPIKLGMTYASLVWAGLEPKSIDGGMEVGAYRVGFAPARGGPITSVHVKLGDLPNGLRVAGKLLKNESTSLQELADAVGSCDPIEPNIGQASTSCHGGRILLKGAGPVGGILTITVKAS